jgi:hypothetical protein
MIMAIPKPMIMAIPNPTGEISKSTIMDLIIVTLNVKRL